MLTVLLQVKSNDPQRRNNDFYIPATSDFKKFPRTESGLLKAVNELIDKALSTEWVADWNIVVYKGKFQHYKSEMQPWFMINSKGEKIAG